MEDNKNRKTHGLIVVSAPSGAGKSSLCERLLLDLGSKLKLSISTTSRLPRGAEQNGVAYYFVSRADFEQRRAADEFAEWAEVHGNFYGTSKKTLTDFWDLGFHVLLDIDVQGAATLKALYPHCTHTIFIEPPSLNELERRLRARGTDSNQTIEKRLKNAQAELAKKNEFDLVILNDNFDNAYGKLKSAAEFFMHEMERGQWHPSKSAQH